MELKATLITKMRGSGAGSLGSLGFLTQRLQELLLVTYICDLGRKYCS